MKPLSEKIIRPINEANVDKGRINRKVIQNIFFIDIDRPKKMNGFTPYMFKEMAKAFTEFENEDNALCAIVYTSGDNFCAGMDLNKMKKLLKKGDHSYIKNKNFIDPLGLNKPVRSKPLIVAVKGITFTYGLELMLSADIALAAKNTTFAMLEVKRGLLMTGGATLRFVERSGWSNAMKYLLTGIKFDSQEAYRMNLVQEVVDENYLFTRAVELAGHICQSSPLAIKEVIKNSRLAQIDSIKAIEKFNKVQNKLIKSKDFAEGLKSFEQKRDPSFKN
ncbi:MAG: Enoyl-CoA-hydratase [Alphaproteobacteria bacterium MarineAlpha9_Bin4]|nr:enoyl-CoA hydratase [Pelagibacterales bacterium]PPR26368.1 MAG: Enoyl-CoA-hydratase [Alphaproteobacteria bacterium MarineAlpha9_Bin4]|tara:strand:+ start:2322 stop:3152 length:831 start_codon:yes stop_codon:yes gene_type:complete